MPFSNPITLGRPLTPAELADNFDLSQTLHDEAQTARDQAVSAAGIFASTTAGIAGTTNGQYFCTPSVDSAKYLVLYRNNSGTAVEVSTYPSKAAVDAVLTAADGKLSISGGTMTGNLTVPSVNGGQLAGLRNRIINGSFDIWQRGTSFSVAASGDVTYVADRYGISSSANALTVSRITGEKGRHAIKVQRNAGQTGTSGSILLHALESANSIPLAGKEVTLSFWCKVGANFTGTVQTTIRTGTGTDESSTALRGGTWTGNSNDVKAHSATTTLQRFTHTSAVPAGTKQIGFLISQAGPTGTAGADDSFTVEQVQLEEGSVATPFEQRPIGLELALCQRYYYRVSSDSAVLGPAFSVYTNNKLRLIVPFPVTMRAAPAALEQTGTASNYGIFFSGATTACTAVPVHVPGAPWFGQVELTASSGHSAGQAGSCFANAAGAYLGFSAEL